MYKIAVIGDMDSIYGFASVGLDIYPVNDPTTAMKTIKSLVENKYGIIYITEALQDSLETQLEVYRTEMIPAIIPIPGVKGNTGKGMINVKRSVEQAVGSDIIFNN